MLRAISIAAVCAALLTPVAGSLAGGFEDIVDSQLAKAAETYAPRGYSPTVWRKRGALGTNAEARYTIRMVAGTSVTIVGACNHDCDDFDISVIDPAGGTVASDTQDDDVPIAALQPRISGDYIVRVMMVECATESCDYGLQSFVKD